MVFVVWSNETDTLAVHILRAVATDALVLQHQGISSNNAKCVYKQLNSYPICSRSQYKRAVEMSIYKSQYLTLQVCIIAEEWTKYW